jgi:plasmid stabilization system protein ParE
VIAGTPFLVVYRALRAEVDVLALFHGARQWPENSFNPAQVQV